jgi:stringent starvation protein B
MTLYNLTTLLEREWYGDQDDSQVDVTVHIMSPRERDKGERKQLYFADVVTDVVATNEYLSFEYRYYGHNTNVVIPISSVLYITYTVKEQDGKVSR